MSNRKNFITVIVLALLCSGCSMTSEKQKEVLLIQPEDDAFKVIERISVEARDELRLLAKYQESLAMKSLTKEQHEQKFFQSTYIPEGFEQVVNINITDNALKVAEAIATLAGYGDGFEVIGVPLAKIPPVTINIVNKPLNEALKELGAQTGDVIDIEVYPSAKVMYFKYNTGH